jgi:hypothetical protein
VSFTVDSSLRTMLQLSTAFNSFYECMNEKTALYASQNIREDQLKTMLAQLLGLALCSR